MKSVIVILFLIPQIVMSMECVRDKRSVGGRLEKVTVTPDGNGSAMIEWQSSRNTDLKMQLPCQIVDDIFINCEKPGSPIPHRGTLFFSRLNEMTFLSSPKSQKPVTVGSILFYLRTPNPNHQTSYIERRYEFPVALCSY